MPTLPRPSLTIIALLLAAIAPARAQLEVYFTQPVDTTLASSPGNRARHDPNVAQRVARLITSASSSVDMAMYNLNVQPIVDALVAAHRRGVRVRVIANLENVTSPTSRFQQLAASGVPVAANPRAEAGVQQPLMHNKFFLIDARDGGADTPTVVTGSWNATVAQTFDDANNVVIIRDVAVAAAYRTEFEEMWGSSTDTPNPSAARFGASKANNTPHIFTLSDGTRLDVYFSPSDAVETIIRNAISTAQTSLFTANLTITSRTLADQAAAQKGRGADVRVLVESIDDQGTQFATLAARVEALSTATVAGQLHHKYAIADAMPIPGGSVPLVVTGSHNWTFSANSINDENTLVIYSAAIANQFLQEFAARYREAGGTRPFGGPSSVEQFPDAEEAPLAVRPNPFTTTLRLSRALDCECSIALVDPLGRIVARAQLEAGSSTVHFDEGTAAVGTYLLRVVDRSGVAQAIPVVRVR